MDRNMTFAVDLCRSVPIGSTTLYRLLEDGRVQGVRSGVRWYIARDLVAKYRGRRSEFFADFNLDLRGAHFKKARIKRGEQQQIPAVNNGNGTTPIRGMNRAEMLMDWSLREAGVPPERRAEMVSLFLDLAK